MRYTYFLGANSRAGFFSLYDGFPPADQSFLHILKSGPGTGKSGFLRKIGLAAEERGLDVHAVLCSGDPDSLDGVYIPALGEAWADGTAPHVLEPRCFAADSDYLNLGRFFVLPFTQEEKNELQQLQARYRALYGEAYRALDRHAAMFIPQSCPTDDEAAFFLSETGQRDKRGSLRRCFLSAISYKGILRLRDAWEDYRSIPCSPSILRRAASVLPEWGWDVVYCPSPLEPAEPELLLLPEKKTALRVSPDALQQESAALSQALLLLKEAKELHDEMEAVYYPHMDFAGLSAFTEHTIQKLFA
jgi:hypothetical protein